MTTRTGGQILVEQLRIQGCDRIFTVPGESFLAVLDALHDAPRDRDDRLPPGRRSQLHGRRRRQDDRQARRRLRHPRARARPTPVAGVHVAFQDSTPMILFVGDLDRADRDREGFQEIDMAAFFGPIAKWAARIDDARRIPEYVARAFRVATAGRPGPVVLALPEDMLRDEVEAVDRPEDRADRPAALRRGDGGDVRLARRTRPTRWRSSAAPAGTATRRIISRPSPGATESRPPPPSAARTRSATNAASMPASSATAPTPSCSSASARPTCCWSSAPASARRPPTATSWSIRTIPDQLLVHVHPDPNELGRVFKADLPICADMGEFAEMAADWHDPELVRFHSRRGSAPANGSNGASRRRATASKLDLGPCVKAMRDALPANTIICNGAGNFSGWWHRYWHYGPMPTQLAPTSGHDGLWPARRGRRRAPLQGPAGGLRRRRRRFPDERAGAGDRRAIWRRPAGHPGRQRRLWHHPHAPGARLSQRGSARPSSPTPISSSWPRLMAAGPSGSRRPRSLPPRLLGPWSAGAFACSTASPTWRSFRIRRRSPTLHAR